MVTPKPQELQAPACYRYYLFIFTIPFVFFICVKFFLLTHCMDNLPLRPQAPRVSDEEWDVLIFTQHWPNTVCLEWEEKNPTNNTCHLPKEKDLWTIHGIWPTKLGTLGPSFCNSSYHFNITQLTPIVANLSEYWIDIEVEHDLNSFWRHEWRKHGTCSSSVPSMNTELGYFKKGLDWLEEYNMKDVLSKGGVVPNSNSSVDLTSVFLAVKTGLGVNPFFHCFKDKKTQQYYLGEIRICFDKSLKLIDCDGVKLHKNLRWKPLGNCPNDKPIFYPSTVPSKSRKPIPPPPDTSIVSLFKVIWLAMWLTY